MEQGPHVLFVESVQILRRVEQTHDLLMLNHDALGLARRPRRVDHVRQIRRRQSLYRRVFVALSCLPIFQPARIIQRHDPRIVILIGSQRLASRRIAQHQHWLCVSDKLSQSLRRIARVQRDVCSSRLQDPQQPHHHPRMPLDAQPHKLVWPYSLLDQQVRHSIRLAVELLVRQLYSVLHHCDRFRRPPHLLFKQLVDASLARIRRLCLVPLLQ